MKCVRNKRNINQKHFQPLLYLIHNPKSLHFFSSKFFSNSKKHKNNYGDPRWKKSTGFSWSHLYFLSKNSSSFLHKQKFWYATFEEFIIWEVNILHFGPIHRPKTKVVLLEYLALDVPVSCCCCLRIYSWKDTLQFLISINQYWNM